MDNNTQVAMDNSKQVGNTTVTVPVEPSTLPKLRHDYFHSPIRLMSGVQFMSNKVFRI